MWAKSSKPRRKPLTAVQIALLTIYDMCKAADKRMVITAQLLEKHGGKSGSFVGEGATPYAVRWPARRGLNPDLLLRRQLLYPVELRADEWCTQ